MYVEAPAADEGAAVQNRPGMSCEPHIVLTPQTIMNGKKQSAPLPTSLRIRLPIIQMSTASLFLGSVPTYCTRSPELKGRRMQHV